VVVDDHDMGITHVIRGDDHLSNAARQMLIYQGLGWEAPVFAHLPLIHGPDGAKLSKRHGAQAVSEFAEMGYLPEAMRNYLARLGWGHGDDEIFADSQAIGWFDIADVVSAPARLDWAKLNHINNHYIRQADVERLVGLVTDVHKSRDRKVREADVSVLQRTIPLVRDGAKTLLELADATVFALKTRPLEIPEKGLAQLNDETRARLSRLRGRLAGAEPWELSALEGEVRGFAEAEGVGIGKFGPALRTALAGGSPAPDLASTLVALGKMESLGRLDDVLSPAP
jgi:glutamyl-tRNA synthetase